MRCPQCQTEVMAEQAYCSHCGCALDTETALTGQVRVPNHRNGQFVLQLRQAVRLWQAHMGDLAALTLVLLLLIWIPLCNLAFIAGYVRALVKLVRRGERPQVSELFQAWDCFGSLLTYMVLLAVASTLLSLVPVLGALAAAALGFAAYPGFYRIIDRSSASQAAGALDVWRWSLQKIRARPVDWVSSYLVGGGIAALGSLLFFIGLILALPLASLLVILQYENSRVQD